MEDNVLYSNVAAELIEIFKFLDRNIYKKIPKKVIENLDKKRNKEYTFKIDEDKTLNEQNLLMETKQILSIIYLKYCCTKEESEELLKLNNKKITEEETNINYSVNNIFKNNYDNINYDVINDSSTQLTVIEDQPFYIRLIEKIKNIFGKIFGKKDK